MFQFAAFPVLSDQCPEGRGKSHSEILGSKSACDKAERRIQEIYTVRLSTTPSIQLLATSFFGCRAKASTIQRSKSYLPGEPAYDISLQVIQLVFTLSFRIGSKRAKFLSLLLFNSAEYYSDISLILTANGTYTYRIGYFVQNQRYIPVFNIYRRT